MVNSVQQLQEHSHIPDGGKKAQTGPKAAFLYSGSHFHPLAVCGHRDLAVEHHLIGLPANHGEWRGTHFSGLRLVVMWKE